MHFTLPSRLQLGGETVHTGGSRGGRCWSRLPRCSPAPRRAAGPKPDAAAGPRAARRRARPRAHARDEPATTARASSSTAARTASSRRPWSRCATPTDVRAVVRWADRYDIPLVSAPAATATTATRPAAARSSSTSAGSTASGPATASRRSAPARGSGDVYAALAAAGVTIPAGSVRRSAIGGLVLGGGMGLAGRAFGLTLDRVTSFDVVTADGRRRRVDDGDDCSGRCAAAAAASGSSPRAPAHPPRRPTPPSSGSTTRAAARDEALAAWDAFAPQAPRALTAILTLDAQRRDRVRPVPRLRADAAPADRAAAAARPRTGSADYLTVQRRWAGDRRRRARAFAASSLYVEQAADRARPHARSWPPPTPARR